MPYGSMVPVSKDLWIFVIFTTMLMVVWRLCTGLFAMHCYFLCVAVIKFLVVEHKARTDRWDMQIHQPCQ